VDDFNGEEWPFGSPRNALLRPADRTKRLTRPLCRRPAFDGSRL